MKTFPRLLVLGSSVATALTGIVYWWMDHMMTPADEWAVVNHPLQPWVLKAHIIVAPLLVFAIGLITVEHIWKHYRAAVRKGRRSGLSAMWVFAPMVVTGYLIQAVTSAGWLEALAWLHLATGLVYTFGLAAHQVVVRRRNGNGAAHSKARLPVPGTVDASPRAGDRSTNPPALDETPMTNTLHEVRPRERRRRLSLLLVAALVGFGACSDGGPTDPGNGNGNPPPGADPYDHTLAPGASAADLLAGSDFDSLVVQINYVQGYRPTDAGIQILADFLAARLNKPRGIEIRIEPALQIAPQATYSVAQVRALEQQHRTAYTEGRTLAVHFLFLPGEYSEQANVLGFAYNNTSMAIFEQKIQDNSGGVTQPATSTVEGVVANHEVGHLLGLVNNGSAMQTEHHDDGHPKHCDDPDCLMYYAVRTTDFIDNLLGGMPTLDQDCIDDLRANGGK